MSVKSLQDALYDWVSGQLLTVDRVVWTFDDDLVAGNSIVVTLNGSTLAPVAFNTDNDTTMANIATAIEAETEVATAVASGTAPNMHTITITGETDEDIVINMVEVTGGASQAVIQTNVRHTRSAVPAPVVWEGENAPRPDEPYVTLKTFAFLPVGTTHTGDVSAPDDAPALGERDIDEIHEFTLNITAYVGEVEPAYNAYQRIINLVNSVAKKLEVQTELAEANIGFVSVLATDDLTGLRDTIMEARAYADLRFRTSETLTESVPVIETVEFDGNVNT